MAPRQDRRQEDSGLRSAATLVAIPSLLIVSPLVGFFVGNWGDKKLHTAPWLALTGLVLGFAAGAREVWQIYKRYLDESKER